MRIIVMALAMAATVFSGPARASEAVFSLVNDTHWDITHVYISTPGDGVWTYDLLDMTRLSPGQEARIAIPEFQGCQANLRVRFANGRLGYRSGLNLCRVQTVRLH